MWLVLIHLNWVGIAFAMEGFQTGGRHLNYQTLLMDAEEAVKEDSVEDQKWRASQATKAKKASQHLNYQTLLMDAEEAVKEDRVADEKWRAAQATEVQDPDEDRLAARAKKAHALRQKHREQQLQHGHIKADKSEQVVLKQKKHPGFQALVHDVEEAEREDREADARWEEEDPEADEEWQTAHALFEKVNQGHAKSINERHEHREVPGYQSHFLKWTKKDPVGFQHLLGDELKIESEEREAEREAIIEEQDDDKMVQKETIHDAQQIAPQKTSRTLSTRKDRQLHKDDIDGAGFHGPAGREERDDKDRVDSGDVKDDSDETLRPPGSAEKARPSQPSTKDEELQNLVKDDELQNLVENEKNLAHEIKEEQKLVHSKLNHKQHGENSGFDGVLKDEKKLIDKLKHEAEVVHGRLHNQHHKSDGFQTLLRDEELAVQRKKEARNKPDVQANPGFQTLLKDEENWIRGRQAALDRSEFLGHGSQQVAGAKYRPLDDMPDTGSAFRSIPNFEWGGKGSFWHTMGRRNKADIDFEDQDVQRMKEAAEHETEIAASSSNPEDLHDASRSFGSNLVHEVGSMSSWGQVKQDPDEDKPAMDMIEQMRAEYCAKRPEGPMNHKDCSKWMFDACKTETSTAGWCDKFRKSLTDYCGKHPEHKYCEGTKDTDGDGILDDIDVFPTDGKEWEDSDGDGVGNNADAFDEDPEKHAPEVAPAPAPALAGPAAPPAVAGEWPGSSNKKAEGVPYPEQGYNEYHRGNLAAHNDKQTWVGDWGGEWPLMDETHQESIDKACADEPDNDWCLRQARVADPSYPKEKGLFDWLFR
eukprot:gnl/MRDRNA2_/MRDRNA2_88835_c0_seq1.p1 gnl/MRDRNA2_/MRDRNA2_88835_c0~~gnl/MRDRNA2_/MRDRNA2_88835_c0_seq1.p1  ORF type:complete len:816 (+),score=235.44 gnl/MRDRNA2_/MRDRNA2_88835_c0_seq1:122-2569(+)